ncbi:site-specific integrase [Pseudomonas sp. CCI1.2]|uniref:site-specific integrase n=1 Tax=unclassified Pseudomonas TaxID=196821 RepID=UPI002AC9BEEB|nr:MULTISPECIES: site-specific integrase [unclassified Pseudomonas]MEB0092883.1 site-specific integrase [Pseudomonas sp. CCI4.2]MEB0120513.1 site-specific integrase [Pseudomonas sp. CCI1.2]WPX55472.1 site-specific integrase [Pseudomonas sp. CCI4.2]
MSQRDNLYRRQSGIYVLRIIVPTRHRDQIGQREIHISTRTTDRSTAKAVACRFQCHWHSCLSELEVDNKKLVEIGPLLTGKGLISINELSNGSGLDVGFLLREMLINKLLFVYEASSQPGFLVHDFFEVERESGTSEFILNSAMEVGEPHTFDRLLKPFSTRRIILSIIDIGFCDETVFRVSGLNRATAFFDLPGIRLTASTILISKVQAERLISGPVSAALSSAAALPRVLEPSPSSFTATLPPECCRPERAKQVTSSLMEMFLDSKKVRWGPGQQKKMAGHCRTFVELMSDPLLGTLSRELIREYTLKLNNMPADRNAASLRHGTKDTNQLLILAEQNNEVRLSPTSVDDYMKALSSMFTWAVDEMILTHNPAKKILERPRSEIRDQDQRSRFEREHLTQIFSVSWFTTGTGERNKQERFHHFRPHHYWLPLLGLYTGARLNEIAQLNLEDIKISDTGVYYFDITLEASGEKIVANGNTQAPEKSLKNKNSKRTVPMHPHLVELGLPEYVTALVSAGYDRLFPELAHDAIKGYGKPAGTWFNGRFLGQKLKIPRDGKLSFHSFRHGFITALDELDTPPAIQAQLAGHVRGSTETANRYRKDRDADKLKQYVDPLDFALPSIKRFMVADGLDAIRDALFQKEKIAIQQTRV